MLNRNQSTAPIDWLCTAAWGAVVVIGLGFWAWAAAAVASLLLPSGR